MIEWQYLLLGTILFLMILLWIVVKIKKFRLRKERDFTRRLETLLLPKAEIMPNSEDRLG